MHLISRNNGAYQEGLQNHVLLKGDDQEGQVDRDINAQFLPLNHGRKRVSKNSWLISFADLYVETFNPLLLLLPIMFVHIGILRASILMAVMTLLQAISAKLNFESTRLQHENLNFMRNEDFETMISAPRVGNSWLITIFSKLYPVGLVLHSAIAIMLCSLVTDQMATVLIFRDEGLNQFLFGLLPALNEDKKPVANTELIKMSRGFVICASLALFISLLFCFRSSSALS